MYCFQIISENEYHEIIIKSKIKKQKTTYQILIKTTYQILSSTMHFLGLLMLDFFLLFLLTDIFSVGLAREGGGKGKGDSMGFLNKNLI